MSEQAFNPDFLFSRITNVNFGGQWFTVLMQSGNSNVNMSIDFPQLAGGTPGFNAIQNGAPSGPWYQLQGSSAVHRITSADLRAPLKTAAGAALTGFGVSLNNSQYVQIFLLMGGFFKSVPFRLRGRWSGNGSAFVGFLVATFKKDSMKAGIAVGFSSLGPPFQSSARGDAPGSPSGTVDFMVDPNKLTVTGPL